MIARDASLAPTTSVAPESWPACPVAPTWVKAIERVEGEGLTLPPLPTVLPQETSRTRASAALDAERQALGEHLRKAARANTSLRFIDTV